MPKKGVTDQYEDFYNRRILEVEDVDELIGEGGANSLINFFDTTRDNFNKDTFQSMFPRKTPYARTMRGKKQLGGIIFDKFIEGKLSEKITKDKLGKVRVAKGQTLKVKGKTYKGGYWLPQGFSK